VAALPFDAPRRATNFVLDQGNPPLVESRCSAASPLAIGTSADFLLAVERRWMGVPHRDRLFFFGV
jgi:hypothetical protein